MYVVEVLAWPSHRAIQIWSGSVNGPGPQHPGVVERLDAGAGAGVDAGDVAQRVQLLGPGAEEVERGLAARAVGDVVPLEVVPERAARHDPERLRRGDRRRRLGGALLERLRVGARGVDLRADHRVVAVAGERRVARGLRAERDRQQAPAVGQLGADPGGGEVGLVTAAPRGAGDVDADRLVRRRGQPRVHRRLVGRVALVEAQPGVVARRDRVGEQLLGDVTGPAGAEGSNLGPGGRWGQPDDRRAAAVAASARPVRGRCGSEARVVLGRDIGWLLGEVGGRVPSTVSHTSHTRHRVRGNYKLVIRSRSPRGFGRAHAAP